MKQLYILAAVILTGYRHFGGLQGTDPDNVRGSVSDNLGASDPFGAAPRGLAEARGTDLSVSAAARQELAEN